MRLTERDLDPKIVAKLNQLDTIPAQFDPDTGKVSFVTFDGSRYRLQYFYAHLMNQALSEDDINILKHSVGNFKHDRKVETNLSRNLNVENVRSQNFPSMGVNINQLSEMKVKAPIKFIKYLENDVLIVTETGAVFKINLDARETVFSFNMITEIKRRLGISDISVSDILDVLFYQDGILLSTTVFGIIYVSAKTVEAEIIAAENDVTNMLIYGRDNLICTINQITNNVVIYNLTTKKKTDTFNQLKRAGNQTPRRLIATPHYMFILGRNQNKENSNKVLHAWRSNEFGTQLNNISSRIINSYENDLKFRPSFLEVDFQYLYLVGFRKENAVIYRYNLNAITDKPTRFEISLEGLDISDARSICVKDNKMLLGFYNRIIEMDIETNKISRTLLLDAPDMESLNIINGKIYYINGESLFEYDNPSFNYVQTFSIEVLNSVSACNNIDIFVKGMMKDTKIALIDENAKQFSPEMAIRKDDGVFIKIIGSKSTRINMKLEVAKDDVIEGIAIHKNQIYYNAEGV